MFLNFTNMWKKISFHSTYKMMLYLLHVCSILNILATCVNLMLFYFWQNSPLQGEEVPDDKALIGYAQISIMDWNRLFIISCWQIPMLYWNLLIMYIFVDRFYKCYTVLFYKWFKNVFLSYFIAEVLYTTGWFVLYMQYVNFVELVLCSEKVVSLRLFCE